MQSIELMPSAIEESLGLEGSVSRSATWPRRVAAVLVLGGCVLAGSLLPQGASAGSSPPGVVTAVATADPWHVLLDQYLTAAALRCPASAAGG